MCHRKNQSVGIMLIELLLALTMSLSILAALTTVYLSTQQNQAVQAAFISIEENARMALQVMQTDIRMAGYIGCPRLSAGFSVDNNQLYAITPENKLSGTENSLTIRRAGSPAATVLKSIRSSLTVTSKPHFEVGNLAIISDCKHAEIFEIDHVSANNDKQIITAKIPLSHRYNNVATVSRVEVNHYFVQPEHQVLLMKNIFQHQSEVVTGVKAMQLRYDIEENGEIFTVSANQISDWSRVVGVRIKLDLVSSKEISLLKSWYSYVALRE